MLNQEKKMIHRKIYKWDLCYDSDRAIYDSDGLKVASFFVRDGNMKIDHRIKCSCPGDDKFPDRKMGYVLWR